MKLERHGMNPQPKQSIKATRTEWKRLVGECFHRDGCCQLCGSVEIEKFIPHHIIPKGRVRIDALWNLLTLCHGCHVNLHDGRLEVTVDDLIERYRHRFPA